MRDTIRIIHLEIRSQFFCAIFMLNFRNATRRDKLPLADINCAIIRDLRLLILCLIRARSTKCNILNAFYAKRVFALIVLCVNLRCKLSVPKRRGWIYLLRAKDYCSSPDTTFERLIYNGNVNVWIRCNTCREINNVRDECGVGCGEVGFTVAFAARRLYVLSPINVRRYLCYRKLVLMMRKSFDIYDHNVVIFLCT